MELRVGFQVLQELRPWWQMTNKRYFILENGEMKVNHAVEAD